MKRWLVIALGLASGLAYGGDVPAVLHWSQRVELATPVSGVVRSVQASVGERVKKGQVLLRLDDRLYAGRTDEAAASVARQKAVVDEEERNLNRVQELYDRTVISTSELEQAQLRRATAAARLKEMQARLGQETKNREDTVLRAPFDAVVVARQAEPGQLVAVALQPQVLMAVAKSGEMVARAQISAAQADGLKLGQEVAVRVRQQAYRGKVAAVGVEPVQQDKGGSPLYLLDVAFGTGDGVMRSGDAASVALP